MARWHWAGLVILALSPAAASEADLELQTGTLNSSQTCATCHEDIYRTWSRSMHAASFTDPIFQASYMQAHVGDPAEAKKICLSCHAPGAHLNGDLDLRQEVSREGITCDFCHSITSVDLSRPLSRFDVKLDGVKRGPLSDAESPVHDVASSPLHKSSEFCAGCHEWTNSRGVSVLTTYSEWKTSPQAANGKTCLHCHMPITTGRTVRSDLGVKSRRINLHDISGMHSKEQVRKAATARVLSLVRSRPDQAVVEVEVANVGSGHFIPTGLATRQVILDVLVFNGSVLAQSFERVYQKILLDEHGRVITVDHETMLNAADIREDTRLRPGEKRIERFVATVPDSGSLRAEINLRYSYTPMLLSPQSISIEMVSERFP